MNESVVNLPSRFARDFTSSNVVSCGIVFSKKL